MWASVALYSSETNFNGIRPPRTKVQTRTMGHLPVRSHPSNVLFRDMINAFDTFYRAQAVCLNLVWYRCRVWPKAKTIIKFHIWWNLFFMVENEKRVAIKSGEMYCFLCQSFMHDLI